MAGSDDMRPECRTKLTYDDFVLFPEDGMRHELIDGEHYVTPSPNRKHQEIGRLYLAPFDVVMSRFDVVEPDLLYMSNERAAQVLTDANVQGVPELVIEVGSPSTRKRDETIKTPALTSGAASVSTGSWTRSSMSSGSTDPVRTDSRRRWSCPARPAMF